MKHTTSQYTTTTPTKYPTSASLGFTSRQFISSNASNASQIGRAQGSTGNGIQTISAQSGLLPGVQSSGFPNITASTFIVNGDPETLTVQTASSFYSVIISTSLVTVHHMSVSVSYVSREYCTMMVGLFLRACFPQRLTHPRLRNEVGRMHLIHVLEFVRAYCVRWIFPQSSVGLARGVKHYLE